MAKRFKVVVLYADGTDSDWTWTIKTDSIAEAQAEVIELIRDDNVRDVDIQCNQMDQDDVDKIFRRVQRLKDSGAL